jgi:hypothetical protein
MTDADRLKKETDISLVFRQEKEDQPRMEGILDDFPRPFGAGVFEEHS